MRRNAIDIMVAIVLLPFGAINANETPPRAMSPVDFVEMPRIGKPRLAPTGERLIYQKQLTLWSENETVDRLRLVDTDGTGDQLLIDPVEPDEDFSTVEWTADGSGIVTLLKRHDDDHKQAYLFTLADRALTRLTDHPTAVRDVAWSPDGRGFYYRADIEQDAETAQRLEDKWFIRAYDTEPFESLWFFDLESRTSSAIDTGKQHIRNFTVGQDGQFVLSAQTPHTLADRPDSELWLTNTASQKTRRLTDNAYAESAAELSPTNEKVAYIASVNAAGEHYFEDNVFVLDVRSGESTLLLPDTPMEILDLAWGITQSSLYLLGNTGLRTQLYHLSLDDQSLTVLTDGDHEIRDWRYNPVSKSHLYVQRDADSPGEVWILKSDSDEPQQITSEYRSLGQRIQLPRQEAFQWQGRDGTPLEGLLVYPTNYKPGDRFPLITTTHGGPRSSSQFGSWNLSRALTVFAGEGYGIFLPNHRGGAGYGDAFLRDMVGGYFTNAHHDILDGIDALIDAKLANPSRLVKMGWSAGGHMTNKMITATDRFKAASSGAGAADWVSMYGESDVRFNRTHWFGGTPWEQGAPRASFENQSLLRDAWRITTPTLFFVGEKDVRVPPTQSIMMHRGTRAAGVESNLFIAPGEPHNFSKPKNQLFKINTELAWFAKHLQRESYTPMYPDATPAEAQ